MENESAGVRMLEPLKNKAGFDSLNDFLFDTLNDSDTLKFLSYSLDKFSKSEISSQTEKHRENNISYLVYGQGNSISGVLALKKSPLPEFELSLLAVGKGCRQKGIGQALINECIAAAREENYPCIDSLVFADNKIMLHLLSKNGFLPVEVRHSARADGMDVILLRKNIR